MGVPEPRPDWSRRLLGQGEAPDPRFTLANERTFLAWIRTALALLGGAGPRVFTTTAAIGHCLLRLVQATGPRPAVIDNADIAAGGG